MATKANNKQQLAKVDIQGWIKKVGLTKLELGRAIQKSVNYMMDTVYKETAKNLNGPCYGSYTIAEGKNQKKTQYGSYRIGDKIYLRGPLTNSGEFPVPKVSSQLSKSLTEMRLSPTIGAVFTDRRKARYNALIHDGGWFKLNGKKYYMKPRPYLGDVIRRYRLAFHNKIKSDILAAVREEGRK